MPESESGMSDELTKQIYEELRIIARSQRRRHGALDTINTTALVHEAYAKMANRQGSSSFADRGHFFRPDIQR